MFKVKSVFLFLLLSFGEIVFPFRGWSFVPSLDEIQAAWQKNYASIHSFACLIHWQNYPDLTTRIWFKDGFVLEEWGIKKGAQEKLFGASLFRGEKVLASTFEFSPSPSFLTYFFYSPKAWEAKGIDVSSKKLLFWQNRPSVSLGKNLYKVYFYNEYFYPLGVTLGEVSLVWENFIFLGNYYLPSAGKFITPFGTYEFSLQWGSLNTLTSNSHFNTNYFYSRYSPLGAKAPVEYEPLFKSLLMLK